MNKSEDGLAGIVAEMFVFWTMKSLHDNSHMNVCDFFGSVIDKDLKIDLIWNDEKMQIWHGDVKGSIKHSNCSIEPKHPFFCQKDNNYVVIFPFRDEKCIYVVNAKALKEDVLNKKQPKRTLKEDRKTYSYYYVVEPNDMNFINKGDLYVIPIVGKHKTFGEFFKSHFKGDEIEKMTEEEIVLYAKGYISDVCKDAIMNYDVPED